MNPEPLDPGAADAEARQRRWEAKQLDGTRPLGAWERYRALNDAIDEAYELVDTSNREARFALILMGGLNAVLFAFVTWGPVVSRLTPGQRFATGAVLATYVGLAFVFLLHAINALRPGQFRPRDGTGALRPLGIRYFEDVVARGLDEHIAAWHRTTVAELNAELAAQYHSLCLKNVARKVALRRLYSHLRLMTVLLAGVVSLVLAFTQIS